MFKAVVGESVYAFIKRRRLERSAFDLSTKPNQTITTIASQYGYSSSNYSAAFKKHYDESPHAFKHSRNSKTNIPLESFDYYDQRIRDIHLEPFTVLYERYIGNYHDLSFQWDDFIRRHKTYCTENTKFIEISYDDPVITEKDRCIYDICMTIEEDIPDNLMTISFEGGRYKAFRFEGKAQEIFPAFQGLFQVWFLQSDIEFDHRKILTIYNGIDCKKNIITMDICIPY